MTVFVVQQPRPFRDRQTGEMRLPDLSPATQYGAVRFVFGEKDQPGLTPGHAFVKARHELKEFTDQDYLLWAGGDPAGLLIAGMVAARVNMGRVNFLRWERNSNRVTPGQGAPGFYVPVELKV
jgi:hypothetical protein